MRAAYSGDDIIETRLVRHLADAHVIAAQLRATLLADPSFTELKGES